MVKNIDLLNIQGREASYSADFSYTLANKKQTILRQQITFCQ
jgi:hypothetical protein